MKRNASAFALHLSCSSTHLSTIFKMAAPPAEGDWTTGPPTTAPALRNASSASSASSSYSNDRQTPIEQQQHYNITSEQDDGSSDETRAPSTSSMNGDEVRDGNEKSRGSPSGGQKQQEGEETATETTLEAWKRGLIVSPPQSRERSCLPLRDVPTASLARWAL